MASEERSRDAGGGRAGDGPRSSRWFGLLAGVALLSALLAAAAAALLMNVFQRKQEAREPFVRVVPVTEDTVDPSVWGMNWPRQYDSYMRTVDYERTRYGGSDAIPEQLLDRDPWLREMFSGHAFALDYREARGHAYMLLDQEETERVLERPQPGACLHCHSSVLPLYRSVGDGDIFAGFRQVNAMPYTQARNLRDEHGELLVTHPASCIDCHDPDTTALRITRPAFIEGIRSLKAHEGIDDYDVNRDASRQELRSYVCAQCHVEYYFQGEDQQLVYPWSKGLRVEQIEEYYDETGFSDWEHGITGAPVLKAQHPEFELWSQGIHARSGVSCSDCHMPYIREGALKVSDHHVRSPLLNVNRACQTCHRGSEQELLERAHAIQDRTEALIDRAAEALTDMIQAIAEARADGVTDEQLQRALQLHRRAQWRLDFVYAENSHGFHAPQESARILAESLDYSRQGQLEARRLRAPLEPPPELPPAEPVLGITPREEAPPSPLDPPP